MRTEQESLKLLTDLERHSKRMIEANIKERAENEKKIAFLLITLSCIFNNKLSLTQMGSFLSHLQNASSP